MRGRVLAAAGMAGVLLQGNAHADLRALPTIDASQACHAPSYPPQARRLEEQGTVVLRFLIGPDGAVQKSEIASSSGYPDLDKAALDAMQLCHFKPGQIDGRPDPNPAWAQLRYTWRLDPSNGQIIVPPASSPAAVPAAAPFVLKCSAQPSDADYAEQLAAVEPQTKIGGTARLSLPPVGGAPQTVCTERFYRALAESLRRSQIFDRLDVVETGVEEVRPRSAGEDYTLWIQGGALAIAYRGGARSPINNNAQGLSVWARSLPQHLKQAQTFQGVSGYSISASMIAGQPYIAYRGGEYLTTVDLVSHVRHEVEEEGRTLRQGPPMGKRLHVLLASEAAAITRSEANAAKAATYLAAASSPANLNLISVSQLTLTMIGYTTAQAQAQALRQTGIYQTIDIEEGDAADPALGSYDAVMWNDPGAPMKWRVKDSLGVVHELSATLPTLQAWLEAVRPALALGAGK